MKSIKGSKTEQNLLKAFAGESQARNRYEVAAQFRAVAVAEKHHEKRFAALLKKVQEETMFKSEESTTWVCMKCGYTAEGKEPQKVCPACGHEHDWYENLNEVL